MNDRAQQERSCAPEEAFRLITEEAKDRGWIFDEKRIGEFYPTTFCQIRHRDSTPIQDGMGKGFGLQGILSARFEAFEHAVTDLAQGFAEDVWYGSINQAHGRGFRIMPGAVEQRFLLDSEARNWKGYWKIFSCLGEQNNEQNGQSVYLFPLSKLDPFSDYDVYFPKDIFCQKARSLVPWVQNNNGSAIGAAEDEAILHALIEAIERYSLSCLYVDCFLKESRSPLILVDRYSIPPRLGEIIQLVEKESKANIYIIDMTTELEIPAYTVKAVPTMSESIALGYGASLDSEYALERAILECQQMLHTQRHDSYGPQNRKEEEDVLSRLADWPRVQSAICIDFEECLTETRRYRPHRRSLNGVGHQVSYLTTHLRSLGIDIYFTATYRSPYSSITAVRVLVPSFSDFSFIGAGLPVVPTGRVLARFYEAP